MLKKIFSVVVICIAFLAVDVMANEAVWLSPTGSGEVYSIIYLEDRPITTFEQSGNVFYWINPYDGTPIEFYNFSMNPYSTSPTWSIGTTWTSIAVGSVPLLSFSNTRNFGVHTSSNGSVQMRVIRSEFDSPLQFWHNTVTVNAGTSFTATINRGSIFTVQARVVSGSSSVQFTMQ